MLVLTELVMSSIHSSNATADSSSLDGLVTARNEVGARLYFHRRQGAGGRGCLLVPGGAWSRGVVPGPG